MDKIKVKTIFAAVSDKSVLDPLIAIFDPNSVKFWGTEGTVEYIKKKKFSATSVVAGFDFDGRVKSLDKKVFAAILADRTNKKHLEELKKLWGSNSVILNGVKNLNSEKGDPSSSTQDDTSGEHFDLVVVDLYALDKNNFPESMDIGGQALIHAAVKNYKSVVLAFDASSLASLVDELAENAGSTSLDFRKSQAKKALEFIAQRAKDESELSLL